MEEKTLGTAIVSDFGACRAFSVAAGLADKNYHTGFLQVARDGEGLKVMGTNGYVALLATIGAKVEVWPRDLAFSLGSSELMHDIRKVTRDPFVLTVEERDGGRFARITSRPRAGLEHVVDLEAGDPHDLTSVEHVEGEPSEIAVLPNVLALANRLANKLNDSVPWHLRTHGALRAFELTCGVADYRIVAMPTRTSRHVHGLRGQSNFAAAKEGGVR